MIFASVISTLGTPVFLNIQFADLAALVARLSELNASGGINGTLYVEQRTVERSTFVNYNCSNFSPDKVMSTLAAKLEVWGANSGAATRGAVIGLLDDWQPTRATSILPPSLRAAVLNWLGSDPEAYVSGSWLLGSYIVWIDQSQPELQLRYALTSTLLGPGPYSIPELAEPKRLRTSQDK